MQNPIEGHPFYVLLETHGSNDDHDAEKLNNCLMEAMEEGYVVDGTIAQDETQGQTIWMLREDITEACKQDGVVYKYDVSLPITKLYELVELMKIRTKDAGIARACAGYGHLGDGNLHLNITAEKQTPELLAAIEPFVYEYCAEHGGSISAEHGLGVRVNTLRACTFSIDFQHIDVPLLVLFRYSARS